MKTSENTTTGNDQETQNRYAKIINASEIIGGFIILGCILFAYAMYEEAGNGGAKYFDKYLKFHIDTPNG
jgi:hypothetical protein